MKIKVTILITHLHHHQYGTQDAPRAKERNIKILALLIGNIEKKIIDTTSVTNIRSNIPKEKKEALKEIRFWNDQPVHL